jgi:hypothetical protein
MTIASSSGSPPELTQTEIDQAMADMDAALLDRAQCCGYAAVDLLDSIMNADYAEGGASCFELRKLAPNLDRFIKDEIEDALAKEKKP